MLKKAFLATVCVGSLLTAVPYSLISAHAEPLTAAQQSALNAAMSSVENLIIQYQSDPDGLQAAIQSLVENAADPEIVGNAVVSVFNDPANETVKSILSSKPGLVDAGGNGLGAAIATIGVTNPTLASQMMSYVQANGGSKFASSVQSGSDTQTSSIQQQNNTGNDNISNDSTPETPASGS